MDKKGQVTIFIILAIVLIGGVVAYFSLRDRSIVKGVPAELKPAYDEYVSCLEETSREGIHLLGEGGGYIEAPEFEPGSAYMPFSSQLDFLGRPIPYWMYVSGNNILKEQVPSKESMERQLERYVNERLNSCDFSDLEKKGYDIYVDDGKVSASIGESDVILKVRNRVVIFKGNNSVTINNHEVKIKSKIGKFYNLARKVYDFEKSNMFLEKYALDVMRLYAPVDGVEIGCTPKVFVDEDIKKSIVDGLFANIPFLKLKGDYYTLSSKNKDYFVVDIGEDVSENVNFMYAPNWPTRIEIYGDRVANPVGLQKGLGALGFCYVPYHLIYDIDFPVLIQFYDEDEVFQFPVGVVISKSQARKAVPTKSGVSVESDVCKYKNQKVRVSTYDADLNPVEARISFKCLDSVCDIGKTSIDGSGEAVLETGMPQCVNGVITARAKGFADAEFLISTNEDKTANIVMDKKYKIKLDLGDVKKAIVRFDSKDYSEVALYPEKDYVELIEGYYNVSVTVYDNSSLKFPEVNKRKCVDVPESGLSGLFGAQTEKCFDINIPASTVDFAVVGGGKTQKYLTLEDLKNSKELNINVPLFGLPRSLADLQSNYLKAEDERIYLDFE